MTSKTFPVVEIFGPVVQGEGAMIGRQTHFVRFGGCDYRCVWCDSLFAVLPDEVRKNSVRLSAEQIVDRLSELSATTPWVTLSGGNPALHSLDPLVTNLKESGFKVAAETQGTLFKTWLSRCDVVTVSPKPPSSEMCQDIDQLKRFTDLPGINLKVVVFDDADYAFAKLVHEAHPSVQLYLQVGNVVGEDTTDALLRKLDWLIQRTIHDPDMGEAIVLPQLHVLLYGNRRGV